ncbi:hypothetical protein BH09GEM1_BH09GEM1_04460 [soil metagenome]
MNLRRLASAVFHRSANLSRRIASRLYDPASIAQERTEQQKVFDRWFADEGDKTLRLDYDLTDAAVVLDVGGYEGQWASDMFLRYRCFIHILEPVPAFAANIARRISGNPRVTLHAVGLGSTTRAESISIIDNESSVFKTAPQSAEIRIVAADEFFRSERIKAVDLMKINIEGGEYDLLEHLIETGLVLDIRNIQVQFHDFVPLAEPRMRAIQASLQETHELTWQYRFVWENWRLRTPTNDP